MTREESILKRTRQSGKNYVFQSGANPRLPAQHWFQETHEGLTFFLVLYTQACRWSQCLGCNLPSLMSEHHVSFQDIMKQIDFVFEYWISQEQKKGLRKIILSNNGSVLDEDTFSTTSLVYFIAKMNMECPNVETLSLESRPEYVDLEELEILSRVLKEGHRSTQLELAIGFEAFDDEIRNDRFKKGLTRDMFLELAEKMTRHKFKLKTYFMIKPVPQMTEDNAKEDIKKAIDFLDSTAKTFGLDINLHLNPTYAAKGTPLETAFRNGTFQPPDIKTVRDIILYAENKSLSIYVGLFDEGLSVQGGHTFHQKPEETIQTFIDFNRTQNFEILKQSSL